MFAKWLAAPLAGALGLCGGAAFAADLAEPLRATIGFDPKPYSFYVHVGPAGLWLSEGATMTAGGAPVPGGDIAIRPKPHPTLAVEIGYFITPNVAVSFTGGLPPRVNIEAAGTLAGLGRLGSTTYGPMTLTAHYHFTGFGRFQPYIGAGPTFMYVFRATDGLLTDLRINHAVGFAVQAGVDVMIDQNWGAFIDVKKAYLRTTASGLLGGAPIRAKVKLDPLVLHAGVTYRF